MKKYIFIIIFALALCYSNVLKAEEHIKNRNLIFNVELGSGNPYLFAGTSVLTGALNQALFKDPIIENSFRYTAYSAQPNYVEVKNMNLFGLNARDLFNDIDCAVKIGCQTYKTGFFNCGFYASGHYKLQQFKFRTMMEELSPTRINGVMFGLTGLFSFGEMGEPSRIILEAGCRYFIPVGFHSSFIASKDQLNSGIVSHFALKFASRDAMQNIGLFVDINHFDYWNQIKQTKLKSFTIGLTWTINRLQADSRH